MKIASLFLLLALISCGRGHSPKAVINEYPTQESEILPIAYDPSESDIILVPSNSLENYVDVELMEGQTSSVDLRILANQTSGVVKSITGASELNLSKNCVKSYEVNESCSLSVAIPASYKGLKMIKLRLIWVTDFL